MMLDQTSNPFLQSAPPSTPPVKLWTPGFIAGVTFLLGFPAGIVIASINWYRMKMSNKAAGHLVGGAVGTFIFTVILLLAPGSASRGIALVANWGILFYLQQRMKKDLEIYKAMDPSFENANQFGGCLIGLGVLALYLLTAFTLALILAFAGVPLPE